ncbi:CoA-binding protein [bacterium]|nr:CoA-binding protein [bacterium]
MDTKKTLIVGASTNADRFSYKAAKRLKENNHPIVLFGNKQGEVAGETITNELPSSIEGLDTITMYLSPENQSEMTDKLIALKPKRIIFNPGTENPSFMEKAQKNNIQVIANCTLVMLSTDSY